MDVNLNGLWAYTTWESTGGEVRSSIRVAAAELGAFAAEICPLTPSMNLPGQLPCTAGGHRGSVTSLLQHGNGPQRDQPAGFAQGPQHLQKGRFQ